MKRTLTCILCPRGCALTAQVHPGQVTVTGNACPRGAAYAESECLHPMRTVTATVRVRNRRDTMVSVKTRAPVPKDRMMDVMAILRRFSVDAPVSGGQVLAADVFGTEIIATREIP